MKFNQPALIDGCKNHLDNCNRECDQMNQLWDFIQSMQGTIAQWMEQKWTESKPFDMEDDAKKQVKLLREMKVDKKSLAYTGILEDIKKWLIILPLLADIRDESMRDRHWDMLRDKFGKFDHPDKLHIKDIWALNLSKSADDVSDIAD